MMPQRLLKIRNFNKPPDSRDQRESDAVSNKEILNLSKEDKENCSVINQESLVIKNDILYVTQPNSEESVATQSNCTDMLSVTQSNVEEPRAITSYSTDILSVTQSIAEEPLATNSNSTDNFEESAEVTNKENSDKNNVTKPNVEEPLATNSYYPDNVVESAEDKDVTDRGRTDSSSSSSSSSSTSSSESNENQDPVFPGVNSDDSVKDPDFSSSSDTSCSDSESNDSIHTSPVTSPSLLEGVQLPKNTRKRQRNEKNWLRVKAKRLRNSGKSYVTKTNKVKPAKKIGPPCTEKCRQKCLSKIREEMRISIFQNFYRLSDLDRQRQFIVNCIDIVKPKYRYTNAATPRQNNYAYHFIIEGKMIRVCKQFFKSTLSINDKVIKTALKKKDPNTSNVVTSDLRGKHGNHLKIPESVKFEIREHINSIPTIESHYCRSTTQKKYIDGGRSLAQYYRDYVDSCKNQNKPFGNYLAYHGIFNNEFNIAFHSPKKDLCDTCVAFDNATGEAKENLRAEYEKHHAEKDMSRKEKEADKNSVNTVIVAVYDLQAVLPCPRGDVSTFYYLSKLNIFNFTIYNLKTKEVECYAWHEGDGHRGVNEIASCIWKYLEKLVNNATEPFHMVFYSDNCCGQQKNKFMLHTYLLALSKFPKLLSISHKFLIKGHSANEGDSAHSLIERRIKASLKSAAIYSPDQYYYLIRSAKVSGKPFVLNELSYNSFFDIKAMSDQISKALPSKNTTNELVRITEMKIIKLPSENKDSILYKTSYLDTDFKEVKLFNIRRRNQPNLKNIELQQLYTEKIKIPEQKNKVS